MLVKNPNAAEFLDRNGTVFHYMGVLVTILCGKHRVFPGKYAVFLVKYTQITRCRAFDSMASHDTNIRAFSYCKSRNFALL